MYNNDLSGAVPASVGNMTALVQLELNDNALTGAIPDTIGMLTNLQALYVVFCCDAPCLALTASKVSVRHVCVG